jgi:hypothetical protein
MKMLRQYAAPFLQGLPGRISDMLLFYAKGDNNTFNQQYGPYDESYV